MISIFLVAVLAAAAPAKHAYTVHDQIALKRLQHFKVSPDGTRVVMTVRETDLEANRGRTDLWLMKSDGTQFRQLTTSPENDTDPVWSPDGKSIFFLSSRGGSSQVWRISLEGGEATAVTQSPIDIDSFNVSRDGQHLAFAAETFPDCDTLECTKKKLDERAKTKSSGRVYDKLMFRHWDTWKDGRRAHLFVQKVSGGTPVDVMKKWDVDSPSKPFGGADEYTFTPDGKSLVLVARDEGKAEAWSTNLDLFSVPIDGSKAPTRLTTSNKATDTQPIFSPDGKYLAYVAMSRPGFEADKYRLMVREWATGKERSLTDNWDRSAEQPVWSMDSKAVYVLVQNLGQRGVWAIDVATGSRKHVVKDGHVAAAEIANDRLFYALDTLQSPSDLFSQLLASDASPKRLTELNGELLSQVKLGASEQFSFKGWNDETVYGYIVKPVDFDAKKKYPLAFLVHGGPQGSFGNDWHYRWNPQAYAGHGYVAVMIDFHGSTGYGQAFTDAIAGDWGGKPLEDLQKGLAAVEKQYPFIDGNRRCALGASYGGFMMNWMAGNWNEPWKCFVNHDGNLDERFAYYDTEELWFPEWEHGGAPWEQGSTYGKHNPIDHVAKWKVPMLVIHGGKDFRVVETHGMATFTALQRRGIPSQFLYFPDENHWVLKPANSVHWHDTVLGWMDKWTKTQK